MEKEHVLLVLLLAYYCSVSVASSVSPSNTTVVSGIFTFGDSIFDAGNNHFNKNCSAQTDFAPYGSSFFHYPTGRFTNGRTVADFICESCLPIPSPWINILLLKVYTLTIYYSCMHIYAAQFIGIDLQKPYLEAHIEVLNGSRKDYPSNGLNFASAGSGVLQATNQDLVRKP